jgi:methionyl-tRNA synthetase
MTATYEEGITPEVCLDEEPEQKIRGLWERTKEETLDCYSAYQFSQGLDKTLTFIRGINKYADERTPWKLAKSDVPADRQALQTCLGTMVEALRLANVLLAPVMPTVHAKINERLSLDPCSAWSDDLSWDHRLVGKKLGDKTILFPREV